jgi:hypothetical protein
VARRHTCAFEGQTQCRACAELCILCPSMCYCDFNVGSDTLTWTELCFKTAFPTWVSQNLEFREGLIGISLQPNTFGYGMSRVESVPKDETWGGGGSSCM